MKIAIASGKGGAGKTTVATCLAASLLSEGHRVAYLDCDVEEPDGHIFLKPRIEQSIPVSLPVPGIDHDKCSRCGICSKLCQFNAIAQLKNKTLIFPELCHSCGGCYLACPEQALAEISREIGQIETGMADGIFFVHGRLRIGTMLSPPLIKQVKEFILEGAINIIDSPPGTSCPAVEALKHADYVVLVAESSPFGLHDLSITVETVRKLKLPMAVIINRSGLGDERVKEFCNDQQIPVLLEIPNDRRIAEIYSKGKVISEYLPEYRDRFVNFFEDLCREAA